MMDREQIDILCKALWELSLHASSELRGELGNYYLQRLRRAMVAVGELFPAEMSQVIRDYDAAKAKGGT